MPARNAFNEKQSSDTQVMSGLMVLRTKEERGLDPSDRVLSPSIYTNTRKILCHHELMRIILLLLGI